MRKKILGLCRSWFTGWIGGTIAVCSLLAHQNVVWAVEQGAPTPPGPQVTVKTIERDELQSTLLSFSLRDGARLKDSAQRKTRVELADLVRIDFGSVASVEPHGYSFLLTTGDVFVGQVIGAAGDKITVETNDCGQVEIPLDWLRQVRADSSKTSIHEQVLVRFEQGAGIPGDHVLVANGDILSGFITSIDEGGIHLETNTGDMHLPMRIVVAVSFEASPPSVWQEPYVVVTLQNGGKIVTTELKWSQQVCEARLVFGEKVKIDSTALSAIEVVGGRWEWLSRRRPISFQHTPMLSLDWDYELDRNVLGGALRVGGRSFDRGIGVHSRTSLTYDLKGSYREFVTSFGLDDSAGEIGDVSVLILVDGKRRFDQADVRAGKLHGPIRLDIERAKHIELVVDFGENGDIQDRFNWIEPALIR